MGRASSDAPLAGVIDLSKETGSLHHHASSSTARILIREADPFHTSAGLTSHDERSTLYVALPDRLANSIRFWISGGRFYQNSAKSRPPLFLTNARSLG